MVGGVEGEHWWNRGRDLEESREVVGGVEAWRSQGRWVGGAEGEG